MQSLSRLNFIVIYLSLNAKFGTGVSMLQIPISVSKSEIVDHRFPFKGFQPNSVVTISFELKNLYYFGLEFHLSFLKGMLPSVVPINYRQLVFILFLEVFEFPFPFI